MGELPAISRLREVKAQESVSMGPPHWGAAIPLHSTLLAQGQSAEGRLRMRVGLVRTLLSPLFRS